MEVNFKVKSDIITFKGINDGVYLEINSSDFDLVLEVLNKKLKESSEFFKGAKFVGVRSKSLDEEQILEINIILKYKYNLNIPLNKILKMIKESKLIKNGGESIDLVSDDIRSKDLYIVESKFVHRTLRSGQAIEHDGNIVVIGDVNPGALLKATVSIIVLGNLRGVAHAGSDGDMNSIIAAYNLSPNQLRIGNVIVRAPDEDIPEYKSPEIAKVYKNEVIIEPYLPNK